MTENDSNAAKSSLGGQLLSCLAWVAALLGPVGTGLLVIILVVFLFYQEENWRGKWAWSRAKAEAAASGKIVDWAKLIPPPVPDEKNFFKADNMQNWFTGRGTSKLPQGMSFAGWGTWLDKPDALLAEVTVVPLNKVIAPGDADLVLRYQDASLTISDESEKTTTNAEEIIPVIVMDSVPLLDAIKHLAKQADIQYKLDPKINYGQPSGPNGQPTRQPEVSCRWTDLTARAALQALLANYNLMLISNPETGIARITTKDPAKVVFSDNNLTTRLGRMLQAAMEPATNADAGEHVTAALGFELSAKPLGPTRPARIVVRSDSLPSTNDIKQFFPKNPFGIVRYYTSETQARLQGSNTFQIYVNPPPRISAADYLDWSDQFESDFDEIRKALKRPFARMDGDYTVAAKMPVFNFVTLRILAQMLSQRAQAHLLLGHPDQALPDLMLVRDLCRITEARPTGQPMTLIAAMINTAITGLYASVVADGLRLHAWRESDLVALEAQMKEINLPPLLAESLENTRLSTCQTLENATPNKWREINNQTKTGLTENLRKFQDPMYLFLLLAPRGWIYQNMAVVTRLHQAGFSGVDRATGLMVPRQSDAALAKMMDTFKSGSPYVKIAAMFLPNFVRAAQTVAHNQTVVNEARIACALERHHLAHREYPETLEALVPQFIDELPRDIIGGQPLKYHRDDNDFTLYSIGWNEVDDKGASVIRADGSGDIAQADWVWLTGKKRG